MPNKNAPLQGINVLDFTVYQNGPSATQILSDYGANVIKIEPLRGEPLRYLSPKGRPNVGFEIFNRGKKSIAIDLKNPDGLDIIKKLLLHTDILCENFRSGVMNRLGLGYEEVSRINPKILYCANRGLGSKGDWSTRPSFDYVAQGYTGVMHGAGGGPSHPPIPIEWAFSDEVGAMNFYNAILTALFNRTRTGKGEHIITSQAAATLQFQRGAITSAALNGGKQRDDGMRPGWGMAQANQILKASDGKYLVVALGSSDQWRRYAKLVLLRDDLLTDDRTKTGMARLRNKEFVLDTIGKVIIEKPRDYWINKCIEHNVPCAPVQNYEEVSNDKFLRENNYIVDVIHRDHGKMTVVGPTTTFSNSKLGEVAAQAPYIGEHTRDILKEYIGMNDTEITRLKNKGVIGTGEDKRSRM